MPTSEIIQPISKTDIFEALTPLLKSMPTKGKVQDRMEGYFLALASFTKAEIVAGIRKFMSGECVGIKTEFVPPPPQLAQIVREAAGIQQAIARSEDQSQTLYGYRRPRSPVIARNVTRNQVTEGRSGGIFPAGCIWCPGPYGENQDFGDLYDPDPDWQQAKPINPRDDEVTYSGQVRQPPVFGVKPFRNFVEPKEGDGQQLPLLTPPTIHDYSNETIEVSDYLLKQLDQKKQADAEFNQQFPDEEGPQR